MGSLSQFSEKQEMRGKKDRKLHTIKDMESESSPKCNIAM